jgi:hypothetical protein
MVSLRFSLGIASLCSSLALACGDDGAPAGDTDTSSDASTTSTGAGTIADGTTAEASTGTGTPTTDTTDGDSSTGVETSADDSTTTGGSELDPRVADCLRIDACAADGGSPMGLQACLSHALDEPWAWASSGPQRLALAAMECRLAADDCDAVRACTPALDAFSDACTAAPGTELCDEGSWVVCDFDGAPIAAMDCAAAGSTCNQDIWAGCGTETCTFGVTPSSCDGDTLRQCGPDGFMREVDCATQYNYVNVNGPKGEEVFAIAGETCGMDEMMSALGCVGTGDPCPFFEQSCDGDVLTTCAGGALAQRDCATLEPDGQSCGFWQSGPFTGAATCGFLRGECDLSDDESCDGGQISYCAWNEPAVLDCVAAGYGGCSSAEADGRTIAWCTP